MINGCCADREYFARALAQVAADLEGVLEPWRRRQLELAQTKLTEAQARSACNEQTCMQLPDGLTCSQCVHIERCCKIYGQKADANHCQWFPRRFQERMATRPQGGVSTCN